MQHQPAADHETAGHEAADHAGAEAAASSGSHPTLRKGVSSEWVIYLQQVLQHVGYWTGEATGTFDDALEAAVQRLQDANGPRAGGAGRAGRGAGRPRRARTPPTQGRRGPTGRSPT